MKNYWCTTCGRHLFTYEHDGTFRLVLKCHSCKTPNDISFGQFFVTTTTYAVSETIFVEVK